MASEKGSSSAHWNWTSYKSCAEAALLGLTSEGWSGHEVFIICADDIVYGADLDISTVELLKKHWPGSKVEEDFWKDNLRRATADNTKAKKLLGFVHRDVGKSA